MSSHGADADGALLFGLVAGLVSFFKGFRVFREYRVLMDTPEMPIRSVPMGLVEIHGKATGEQTVPSPVTQTPCHFYKVDVERWVSGKNGGHWAPAAVDADGVKFYLEDGSGKVLVDAHNAEYDLIRTARVETGGGMGPSLGRWLRGMGGSTEAAGSRTSAADLHGYAQSAISRRGRSISLDTGSFIPNLDVSLGGGLAERYRLSEYLVVPGHWYDLTGTCVENPTPKDDHDRNLITKGTNEPTFLITWRSEKEIRRTLRNRAALHIFGGGAVAVICLAILLLKLGQF